MIRLARAFHPITRLNLIIFVMLVSLQICMLVSVLFFIPATFDVALANLMLLLPQFWCVLAIIGLIYLFWNAFRLNVQYQRRMGITSSRNLALAWAAPILLLVLMATWFSMLQTVFDLRSEWDFKRSQDEMMVVCDEILAEGLGSPYLGRDETVGRYNRVNVTLRDDGWVWFDIGDERMQVGYVCLPTDMEPPEDNSDYQFTRKTDRFYFYEEQSSS